jgi:transcriptional regulator with XRE-family HTH domain
MRTTRSAIEGRRRARQTESRLVQQYVQLRLDSGVAQRVLAREADVSPSSVSRFEAGLSHPTIEWLTRVGTALGADLAVGLYPNTGPPIRDRWQAPMIEALFKALGSGWRAFPETPVTGAVLGVIDAVLVNAAARVVVAVEAESELRRVEQELRWATQKADALASSEWWLRTGLADLGVSRAARLLLLRSTRWNRTVVHELSSTFAAAYPAGPGDVVQALAGDRSWPGDGLVWVTFDGRIAHLSRVRLA